MSETEWLTSADPPLMLQALRGRASDRKLRLFACAVARLLPPSADPAEERERAAAVRIAERFADGLADAAELAAAMVCSAGDGWFWPVAHRDAFEAAEYAAAEEQLQGRSGEVAGLLRDVFGNPFRPVHLDPSWRTADVLALAAALYEDPASEGWPVLADALEEAGCMDSAVLSHCRTPAAHARGCWLLDLLLGRQ